jgi:hypothetical protein
MSTDQTLTAATARAAQTLAEKLGFLDIPGAEIALTTEAVTISLEANAARSLAAVLGLSPVRRPSSWDTVSPCRHHWYGVRAALDVYVIGHGYLADQVPDALVASVVTADLIREDVAPPGYVTLPDGTHVRGYESDRADYRSTEDVADITRDDTAGL